MVCTLVHGSIVFTIAPAALYTLQMLFVALPLAVKVTVIELLLAPLPVGAAGRGSGLVIRNVRVTLEAAA